MIRRFAAILVLGAGTASADETSIFALYDHFAIAQVIGEACAGPTEAEAVAYMAKFEALGEIAEIHALSENPDLTAQSFKQFSARRRHSLQASAAQFLAAEGCDHAEAKALAAKYAEFRNMTLPE